MFEVETESGQRSRRDRILFIAVLVLILIWGGSSVLRRWSAAEADRRHEARGLEWANEMEKAATNVLAIADNFSPDLAALLKVNTKVSLSKAYTLRGEYDKAEEILKQVLQACGPPSASDLCHLSNAQGFRDLSKAYSLRGEYDKAEKILKQALQACGVPEPHHRPCRLFNMTGFHNYASILRKLNRDAEAPEFEAKADALAEADRQDTEARHQEIRDMIRRSKQEQRGEANP